MCFPFFFGGERGKHINKIPPPHPFPGQSCEVVYVYWFFCPPSMACPSSVIVHMLLRPVCGNVPGSGLFCCINSGGLCRRFSWRILLGIFLTREILLRLLSRKHLRISFSNFPGDLWHFEKCFGDFQWSPFPKVQRTKNSQTIWGKIGAKFGANIGKSWETFVLQLLRPKEISSAQKRLW